ncbi:flavin reductase family protein [Rubrivirga sp.]|uniref:flavin reductase family protein n=1 Tax=Rubrivirga sp. TaxID=1885344 RepID=UPI003C74516A
MSTPPTDLRPERPASVPATGEALRYALRDLPSPVAVVTTDPGEPRGATIGSFASVSLDPALVSFNVTHGSSLHQALSQGRGWAVHLLASTQADVAEHFARPDLEGDRQLEPFAHVRGDGPPLLRGALSILLCEPHARFEAGDHTVFVGRVTDVVDGSGVDPLLYYRQSYRAIGETV